MLTRYQIPPMPCPGAGFLLTAVIGCLLGTAPAGSLWAADSPGIPLPRVPPGTAAVDPRAARFNRVVYLAVSRIASGDADSVPSLIRQRVPLFTLALLATVRPADRPGAGAAYELLEVAAGYAVPLAGRLTVIAPDAPDAAAGIDLIGRQVLAANGRHLAELRQVGGNATMRIIDVDAVFHRGGRHVPLVMRHFIWIDPMSGRCCSCVWLMGRQSDGRFIVTADPPRWLREGTRDERNIHVDADAFFLGMPTREAFALSDLPPGDDLTWTDHLREVAAAAAYAEAELGQLAAAVNQALAPLRQPDR